MYEALKIAVDLYPKEVLQEVYSIKKIYFLGWSLSKKDEISKKVFWNNKISKWNSFRKKRG